MSPYWAHTDTRTAGGVCSYRVVINGTTLSNCTSLVRNSYLGQSSFTATHCAVITWDNHPLFGYNAPPFDTVQLVMASVRPRLQRSLSLCVGHFRLLTDRFPLLCVGFGLCDVCDVCD